MKEEVRFKFWTFHHILGPVTEEREINKFLENPDYEILDVQTTGTGGGDGYPSFCVTVKYKLRMNLP